MKQVWKCDHCTDTGSQEKIKKHETECYMNPAVKDCGSCKNHLPVPYEQAWQCKFGWDFEDEKSLPCKKWEA